MAGLPVVWGGAMVGRVFKDATELNEVYTVLEKYGVKIIDSAQLYQDSERLLGETGGSKRFTIDTKWKGSFGGKLESKALVDTAKTSLEMLSIDKVDVFYIHLPDTSVPLADWLPGVQEVYESGAFARFGLSNFQASTVEEVYNYCKEHNYVLPTVYQGNYNPVARKQDTLLIPVLRKLGISFYAYSPIAGGFLTKTKQQILDGVGRFTKESPIGQIYSSMYIRPSYLEALAEWEGIANDVGCSRAELAYRWVSYNSILDPKHGDAIIVGSSSIKQLEETLAGLKNGKLPEDAVKRIDHVWKTIEHEAPLDNFHR